MSSTENEELNGSSVLACDSKYPGEQPGLKTLIEPRTTSTKTPTEAPNLNHLRQF